MDSTIVKKRNTTVDIIKGFAIIAVVLLHINFNFPKWHLLNIDSICGSLWHVAVFFVVSGWFLKDSRLLNFKTFTRGKVVNLYVKALYVYIPLVLLHNVFLKLGWLFGNFKYRHGTMEEYSIVQTIYHIICQFLFTKREPFSGAMWFVDSLFLGLLMYSVVTIFVSKCFKACTEKEKVFIRFVICFMLAFVSAAMRDTFGINIPKVSNTLSAIVLICTGHFLGQHKIDFDNKLLFLFALGVFFQYTVLAPNINLGENQYKDVVSLIVSSVSALYVFGFIGKNIAQTLLGGLIEHIGKESFWIMGFHMVGFHVFTSVLALFGVEFSAHFTTPDIGNNVFLLLGYLLFGVGIPLVIKHLCFNNI